MKRLNCVSIISWGISMQMFYHHAAHMYLSVTVFMCIRYVTATLTQENVYLALHFHEKQAQYIHIYTWMIFICMYTYQDAYTTFLK